MQINRISGSLSGFYLQIGSFDKFNTVQFTDFSFINRFAAIVILIYCFPICIILQIKRNFGVDYADVIFSERFCIVLAQRSDDLPNFRGIDDVRCFHRGFTRFAPRILYVRADNKRFTHDGVDGQTCLFTKHFRTLHKNGIDADRVNDIGKLNEIAVLFQRCLDLCHRQIVPVRRYTFRQRRGRCRQRIEFTPIDLIAAAFRNRSFLRELRKYKVRSKTFQQRSVVESLRLKRDLRSGSCVVDPVILLVCRGFYICQSLGSSHNL